MVDLEEVASPNLGNPASLENTWGKGEMTEGGVIGEPQPYSVVEKEMLEEEE